MGAKIRTACIQEEVQIAGYQSVVTPKHCLNNYLCYCSQSKRHACSVLAEPPVQRAQPASDPALSRQLPRATAALYLFLVAHSFARDALPMLF